MIRRTARVLLALTAGATVAACGQDQPGDAGPARTTAPAARVSTAPTGDVGAPDALRLTAPLVGGGEIDLAGYAGQPVLLWFWAPY